MSKKTKRNRPNYWHNRYNQWVIAGKIAVDIGAINPYNADGKIASVYATNSGDVHYSVIGQEYLRAVGITVTDL